MTIEDRRIKQELLRLAAQQQRLHDDERAALAAVLRADKALETTAGAVGSDSVRMAEAEARGAQEWHRRARVALERFYARRARLRTLLGIAA